MLTDYDAIAYIKGGEDYPNISGTVAFKGTSDGTWIDANINGLPQFRAADDNNPQIGPHGFHIHNGQCSGEGFSGAGDHFGSGDAPHGNHKGDLPALFSNDGKAKMLFFTNKFSVDEIIGKSVVIHLSPDDYHTQPAGGSGGRIACGNIDKV